MNRSGFGFHILGFVYFVQVLAAWGISFLMPATAVFRGPGCNKTKITMTNTTKYNQSHTDERNRIEQQFYWRLKHNKLIV